MTATARSSGSALSAGDGEDGIEPLSLACAPSRQRGTAKHLAALPASGGSVSARHEPTRPRHWRQSSRRWPGSSRISRSRRRRRAIRSAARWRAELDLIERIQSDVEEARLLGKSALIEGINPLPDDVPHLRGRKLHPHPLVPASTGAPTVRECYSSVEGAKCAHGLSVLPRGSSGRGARREEAAYQAVLGEQVHCQTVRRRCPWHAADGRAFRREIGQFQFAEPPVVIGVAAHHQFDGKADQTLSNT